jgi:phosphotransferase system  glucose/maltose/N-acetylglucosamine-specific IIC component
MTWREWHSRDSAWAIIRRGIVVGSIGLCLAISYELLAHPKSHGFWVACVGVPFFLTVFNLLDFLGTKRNEREAKLLGQETHGSRHGGMPLN